MICLCFLIHGSHVPSFKVPHVALMSTLSLLCFTPFVPKHHKGLVFSVWLLQSTVDWQCSYGVQARLRRTALRMSPQKQIQLIFYISEDQKFKMSPKALELYGAVRFVETVGICAWPSATPLESRHSLAAGPLLRLPDLLFSPLPALTFLPHCSTEPWKYVGST